MTSDMIEALEEEGASWVAALCNKIMNEEKIQGGCRYSHIVRKKRKNE